MLELDDIQHFLLTRPHALAAHYAFVTFRDASQGRRWLAGLIEKVGRASGVNKAETPDSRWVTIAFTWNGLRALGVDDASLATFPEEFRQGMAARAEVLGDTGVNHPNGWRDGLASTDLHAIIILFARDVAERNRCVVEYDKYAAEQGGVEIISTLNLEATPPYHYAHDHFGYRDRLSQPAIEGTGDVPTPGSGAALKPGEFFLGYPDEDGQVVPLPKPEVLSRNGSFLAYRRLEEHVGRFRDFLRQQGETPEEQEIVAAKLMGRWRSGAPLVLAPEKDDPVLGADAQRNNDFNYAKMDPHGYAVPLGSHARRMNPRDTAVNMNRRRMIRRGGTYGPALPEGKPDDGIERGIAAFIGCASLVRQFEFAQNVWVNDRNFHELGNERDPFIGANDGTLEYKIPKRPIRKKIIGLPAFTTVRGGAYFFLPGIKALKFLAAGPVRELVEHGETAMAEAKIYVPTTDVRTPARTYNQLHQARQHTAGRRRVSIYVCWSFPGEVNRDVSELDNRFSTMTEVRRVEWPFWEGPEWSDPAMFQQGIAGALELFFRAWMPFQQLVTEVTGHVVPVFQRVDQAGYRLPIDERVLADTDTLLVFGLDHLLTEQEASADEIDAVKRWLAEEGHVLVLGPHHDVGISADLNERAMEYAHHGDALVPRQQRFGKYTRSLMKGLGVPVDNRYGLRPGVVAGSRQIAPLTINRDLDRRGWLEGVTNFSFHKHLPHYAITDDSGSVHVLGRQPVDRSKPHPFTEAGNTEFNSFVWMPPDTTRGGEVLLADSTIFSTLFGADESLKRFWTNLVTAK